jgi:hypothetical protein
MRDDFRARLAECFVRACVIQMPVCVEENFDEVVRRLAGDYLQQVSRAIRQTAVHHRQPVGPDHDHDVRACARNLDKAVRQLGSGDRDGSVLSESTGRQRAADGRSGELLQKVPAVS